MAGAFDIAWAIIKAGPNDPEPYDPFAREAGGTTGRNMRMSEGPTRRQRSGGRAPAKVRPGFRGPPMPMTDTSAESMREE